MEQIIVAFRTNKKKVKRFCGTINSNNGSTVLYFGVYIQMDAKNLI